MSMYSPFAPSEIAYDTTAILDKGAFDHDATPLVTVGSRPSDERNPKYMSWAELAGPAPFLARNIAMSDAKRDYKILPGGRSIYKRGAKPLVPYSPADWPVSTAQQNSPLDSIDIQDSRRHSPHQEAVRVAFPTAQSVFGHTREVDTARRR